MVRMYRAQDNGVNDTDEVVDVVGFASRHKYVFGQVIDVIRHPVVGTEENNHMLSIVFVLLT
jgi:hypothetical protein